MRHLFKWIGGGLGWTFGEWMGGMYGWEIGGPSFAVLGFFAGTIIDSFEIPIFRKKQAKKKTGLFSTHLLVMIAAILKADGRPVVKSELEYVKQFLKQNYGKKESLNALSQLKDLLKQNSFLLDDACEHVRNHIDHSSRLQLTHFLFNLANIDGHPSRAEQNVLNTINNGLKINISDNRSVGRVDVREEEIIMAYGTLSIDRTSSIIEIKKAYRNLANKCHPDKVASLGEEQKKIAKDKFQRLTHAYEIIKKERNFS